MHSRVGAIKAAPKERIVMAVVDLARFVIAAMTILMAGRASER